MKPSALVHFDWSEPGYFRTEGTLGEHVSMDFKLLETSLEEDNLNSSVHEIEAITSCCCLGMGIC
jgi:hypothetical protein